MSLDLFQTYLVPIAKTGAVGFYQKPTSQFPKGRILPATFSAPNIGATSGRSVFSGGNLIELPEDYPDWSEPLDGSGPRILMRPQVSNQVTDFDQGGWTTAGGNLSTKIIDSNSPYPGFGYFQYNRTAQGWPSNIRRLQTNVANPHQRDIYAKYIDVRYLKFLTFGSQVNFSVDLLNKTIDFQDVVQNFISGTVEDIGNDWVHVKLNLSESGTGFYMTLNSIAGLDLTTSSPDNVGSCYLSSPQQTETNYYVGKIPPGITRSANQFTFDDLVTKGVMGENSEFSFLFYAPDSVGGTGGNGPAGLWFYNDLTEVWNFWTDTNRVFRRPYKYAEGNGYINFGSANYNSNEAIVCTYNGQTINFYNSSGLLSTFSFTASQAINKLFIDGSVISHSLKDGYIAFSPTLVNEAQAIQAIADVQNL